MWAWATMTSMVENMSELLVGSYVVLIPCLTRPGITRRISFVECANGGVGATLRFKQEKRQTSLAASSGA